eukprot:3251657-Prymnesium_polylepis.1
MWPATSPLMRPSARRREERLDGIRRAKGVSIVVVHRLREGSARPRAESRGGESTPKAAEEARSARPMRSRRNWSRRRSGWRCSRGLEGCRRTATSEGPQKSVCCPTC